MKYISILSATAALLLATSFAHADSNGWRPTVVIGGSIGIQQADIELDSNASIGIESETGWAATVHTGIEATRDITVLAELDYSDVSFDIGPDNVDAEGLTGFLVAQYRFPIKGYVRPYVSAGVGAGRFELDALDGSDVGFGLKGGLGVDIAVAAATSIFAEANYERYFGLEILNNDVEVDRGILRAGINQRF